MRPGWPPPESFAGARHRVAERNALAELAVLSKRAMGEDAGWSRSFTRARLSTPSCIAAVTFWPLPETVR